MGDFVESLSDAELRTKLAEYGFPVVPITTTTRKVMAKKLKMLIENKNKINTEGRKSLAKYSSEEESDEDNKSKKDKNRRITIGGGMLPPVTVTKPTKKSTKKIETRHDDDGLATTQTKTRRASRLVKPVPEADLETGSDSETEILDEYVKDNSNSERANSSYLSESSKPLASSSFSRPYSSFLSSRPSTNVNSSATSLNSSAGRSSPSKPYSTTSGSTSFTSSTTTRYSSSLLEPTSSGMPPTSLGSPGVGAGGDTSMERLNQIRSRLSLGAYENRKIGTSVADDAPAEAPFLSNFSKRLSQLSSSSAVKPDYNYKNDIIKEHDANGSSYNRTYLRGIQNRDYPLDFKSRQEKNIFKNNFVSFALVGIAIAFFIGITVMYVGIRTDHSAISEKTDYIIPICEDLSLGAKPGLNCIPHQTTTHAINLMKVLLPELTKRAIAKECSGVGGNSYMDDDQIIEFVSTNYALKDPYEIQTAINNLQVLVLKNPKWGISLIRTDINYPTESTALESMDDISENRSRRNLALIILNPNLPWKCIIVNKLYAIISSLLVIGGGFLLIFGGQKLYKHILNQRKLKNEKIYSLVEKIIDILQSNAADNSENFLAVNHVRDMLIPPQERKGLTSIWNAAVKFLEENESRVRTEVQIVSGEEFHVWRWLGANLNSTNSPRKTWQGQAFETQLGSVNSLPCSPTPCLKIRGMFDERERNLSTVREAVLGKCVGHCLILHCEPDAVSRCVYLKCASQRDAAIAYQNLHGWWYDGHLVTVKYLRLERYMQRFPDSTVRGPPFLIASTTEPLENDWTNNDD